MTHPITFCTNKIGPFPDRQVIRILTDLKNPYESEGCRKEAMKSESKEYERIRTVLQHMANENRIRVERISRGGHWYHYVTFYDEKGDEVETSKGYLTAMDAHNWDENVVRWTEYVDEDRSKIRLMLSDTLPEFLGTVPPLNINGDHFCHFELVMHNNNFADDFQ